MDNNTQAIVDALNALDAHTVQTCSYFVQFAWALVVTGVILILRRR
jgi:hypothetical protein